MTKRKKSGGTFLFALVVAGLAVVGWGAGPGGWFRQKEAEAIEGVPVRRGDMRISEVARGNLEAKDSAGMVNELEGRATIIYLIDEGALVEKGDLVCELDVSDLRDERVSQEISVKNAEASFTKAREQYDIQEIQNQSDIAAALLAKELAELDLEKYSTDDGEWEHELAQLGEAIALAQEELKQAENTLQWTTELEAKGFLERTELERDQLTVERARIEVLQAQRERDLARAYGDRRRRAELRAAVETAERDIQKVRKQAFARLADYEAERESARFQLEREKEKLAKLDEQIVRGKIFAPEAGMVVYSRRRNNRYGSGEVPEEGGEVHERQEIASIPRPGGMVAVASLHETKLEKVRGGQTCLVTIDALPGKAFTGEVGFVAAVADSGSWMTNPNQRLYKTDITLHDAVPEMRPGMSCSIEILIDGLTDVLYVPRQCVFLDGDSTVCFVRTPEGIEARQVEVGQDNNKWVEIRAGVQAGEVVLLSPPASWEPAPVSQTEEALPEPPPVPEGASEPGERGEGRDRDGQDGERGWGSGRRGDVSPEQMEAMRKRFEGMTEEERREAMERFRESREQ